MTIRLETVAPDLVEVLERLTTSELRSIAIEVSEWIVRQVGLADPRADAALTALRADVTGTSAVQDRLKVLVDDLDERAWDLQDKVEDGSATQEQYLHAFALARAAASVRFALESDALESALESVYEAQAATGDVAGVRRIIQDVSA